MSRSYVEAEYGYTYDDTDTTASTKIIAHSSSFVSDSYTNSRTDYYEYDASGNITGIYRYVDGVKTYYYTYVYDEAGQLVRENILEDDKTIIYVYDVGGNIVSKKQYAYTLGDITEDMTPVETDTYTYENEEWKDLLTGYTHTESDDPEDSDNITSALTYDAQGNVTSFNGSTYTWNANRQLVSSTTEDGEAFYYFYNENGYLTKLDMYEDGAYESSFIYVWDGDKLVSRSISNFEENIYMTSKIVYDTDGEEIGVVLSESAPVAEATAEMGITKGMLLYRKNLQGDITGLIDSTTGQLIGSYTYDAYGMIEFQPVSEKPLSALSSGLLIAFIPQLYRGYIYTIVGGELCYYLGSRFYSPRLGRFLNADKHTDTGTGVNGTNMFAYCNNNPVMCTDPTGEVFKLIKKIVGFFNQLSFIQFKLQGITKTLEQFANNYGIKISFINNGKRTTDISIDLTVKVRGKTFSDVLYYFYQNYGTDIYNEITEFCMTWFNVLSGRQFLFSDDCVNKEIKEHLIGYWWSVNKPNMQPMIIFQIFGIMQEGNKKDVVKKACEKIDIKEADVYDTLQATAFGYFSGIRDVYKNTIFDPYWNGSYRVPTANENWNMDMR